MTLVEAKPAYPLIKDWLCSYLDKNYPDTDTTKFIMIFNDNKKKLSKGKYFRWADQLVESLNETCKECKIDSFYKDLLPFIEHIFVEPKAYPDAHKALNRLKKYFKIGLISNADNYFLHKSIILQDFKFDFIISSEDAKSVKPEKEIYLYALDILKARPQQAIMIGDSQLHDIHGPSKVKIKGIWVNRRKDQENPELASPIFAVDTLADIADKLIPYSYGLRK